MTVRGTGCVRNFSRFVLLLATAIACLLPASAALAQATLAPSTLSFGLVAAGTANTLSVVLKNTGTAPIQISTITLSGSSDFTFVSSQPSTACQAGQTTLVKTGTCTIGVTLTPSALVTEAGSLTVTTTASNTLSPVTLAGIGIAPVTISPTTLAYGNVALGSAVSKSFTIKNAEKQALNISSLSGLTADFTLDTTTNTSCPMTGGAVIGAVPASSSCVIAIHFNPTTTGALATTIVVNDDAWGGAKSVALTGSGIVPVTISPTSFNYGSVALGIPVSKSFTIKNSENQALNISSLSGLTADFTLDTTTNTTCPMAGGTVSGAVPAGNSCMIAINFDPTTTGSKSATISVNDDALGSPQTFTLSGTGIAPVTISPASFNYGNIYLGNTVSKSFTLRNLCTSSQAASLLIKL